MDGRVLTSFRRGAEHKLDDRKNRINSIVA